MRTPALVIDEEKNSCIQAKRMRTSAKKGGIMRSRAAPTSTRAAGTGVS
jgi:hypothetical protein